MSYYTAQVLIDSFRDGSAKNIFGGSYLRLVGNSIYGIARCVVISSKHHSCPDKLKAAIEDYCNRIISIVNPRPVSPTIYLNENRIEIQGFGPGSWNSLRKISGGPSALSDAVKLRIVDSSGYYAPSLGVVGIDVVEKFVVLEYLGQCRV